MTPNTSHGVETMSVRTIYRTFAPNPSIGITYPEARDGTIYGTVYGWCAREFNYAPRGTWDEWVQFAHAMIAEDERRKSEGLTQVDGFFPEIASA